MSNWVRFHEEIRQGKHRGIPRALRFVFLELCHEARPGRGTIELPFGMGLVDGVHDLLGGSRKEVASALDLYTKGPDPESPTLVIEGKPGALRVVIPSWGKWNPIDESAERMRRLREKRRLSDACDASHAVTVTPSPFGPVTALDKSREDQIRSDPPLGPPQGGNPTGAQGALPGLEAPPKVGKRRGRAKSEGGPCPEGWEPNEKHMQLGAKLGFSLARILEESGRFQDHHRARGSAYPDWNAAFSLWIRNESKWAKERAGRAPAYQPAAKPGQHAWEMPEEIS